MLVSHDEDSVFPHVATLHLAPRYGGCEKRTRYASVFKEVHISFERMEMDVHYLAISARLAEPVAWFELRSPPPADFGFVLIALSASAIVRALRCEK